MYDSFIYRRFLEYCFDMAAEIKKYVFSYGVVALEISRGRKSVGRMSDGWFMVSHPNRSFSPSPRQAIQVLNMESSFPNLPSKMPVALYHVPD